MGTESLQKSFVILSEAKNLYLIPLKTLRYAQGDSFLEVHNCKS